jgi:hypothetical protein
MRSRPWNWLPDTMCQVGRGFERDRLRTLTGSRVLSRKMDIFTGLLIPLLGDLLAPSGRASDRPPDQGTHSLAIGPNLHGDSPSILQTIRQIVDLEAEPSTERQAVELRRLQASGLMGGSARKNPLSGVSATGHLRSSEPQRTSTALGDAVEQVDRPRPSTAGNRTQSRCHIVSSRPTRPSDVRSPPPKSKWSSQ